MGIIIDCAESPPITGPLWRPDACNSGPILVYAMEVLAQYVCDLEVGNSNNIAVVPPATPQADWDTFFDGGLPDTISFVVIGGQLWITEDAGATWDIVNSPEFRYSDGSTFVDDEAPTPAELRALFPESVPTAHAMVYNAVTGVWHMSDDSGVSWNANNERTFRIGQLGDFVDPLAPTAAELNALFSNNPQEQALVYIPTSTSYWYTDDFGATWNIAPIFAIVEGTLAAIQALATAGLLAAGAFYRITDNTHAEGGDIMFVAFDAYNLSNNGWYYHAPRDVWFPIIWDPATGIIIDMIDPLYNNHAVGEVSVDSFLWTANDTLGAAWSNNLMQFTTFDFSAVSALGYGTLTSNTFYRSTVTFTGFLKTFTENEILSSTVTYGNASGVGSLNCTKTTIRRSIAVITNNLGTITDNVISDRSTWSMINNSFTTLDFRDNEVDNASQLLITGYATDFEKNTVSNGSIFDIDTVDVNSAMANNVVSNGSTVNILTVSNSEFSNNTFSGAILVEVNSIVALSSIYGNQITDTDHVTLSDFSASTFSGNELVRVNPSTNFSISTLVSVTITNNQWFEGSTGITDVDDGNMSGNVFMTTLMLIEEIDDLDIVDNEFGQSSTLLMQIGANVRGSAGEIEGNLVIGDSTITAYKCGSIRNNTIQGKSTVTANNTPILTFRYNNIRSESAFTSATTSSVTFSDNDVFKSTVSLTSTGSGGQITSNSIRRSTLTVNSASFTGSIIDNEFAGVSAMTFGAHTGTFSKNFVWNSTMTATKTGAATATGNSFFNTTATLTAGSNTDNTFYVDEAGVFNDAGADVDYRWESDTDQNSLYFDGTGVGSMAQGTATPTAFWHMRASTTAMASYRVPSGTSPTSPNEGDVWNDSTQKSMQMFENGIKQSIDGCIFTQSASVTVSNNSAETTLVGAGVGTMTLPANFLTVGKTIQVIAGGFYGTDAVAPNMVLRLKLGSTTILQQDAGGTLTAGIGNDRGWRFEGEFTVRAVGAAGNAIGTGLAWFSVGGTAPKFYPFQNLAVSGAFNTTGTLALGFTADWDTADADNTITCTTLSVIIKN